MRNWTVGKKLNAGVGAMMVLLLATVWMGLSTATGIKGHLDVATGQTTKKIDLAHRIQENVVRFRSEQRRALVAGFGKDPETVKAAASRITELVALNGQRLDELQKLLVVEAGRKAVADIRQLEAEWKTVNATVFSLIESGDVEGAWSLARDKANPVIDQIDARGDTLLQLQETFLVESEKAAGASYRSARLQLMLVSALAIGVVLVVGWVVRQITRSLRETATNLRQGAEQVTAAASQVSTSSQSLSQGATEQAASLEETSASMEEMASMTRQNAENSQAAASLMNEVDNKVQGSNAALGDMVASMASIQESSQQVAKIIKTIDEIAFQTNILALNAAVEAARAGEAGMGFAVVADEVRNLAQRSAQAARDTASLIEESIAKAQSGNTKVEQVATAIAGITESVTRVKGLVDEVSNASKQQSQGIDQVSQAISQMEKVTQTTAATAEESAAASEELNAQAVTSMTFVQKLDAMVGGSGGGPAVTAVSFESPRAKARTVTAKPAGPRRIEMDDDLPATGTFGKF
jgi:methyl-accepting chemotaxis protein/methyl-accepting chemotaxis protein-1 (serine sensor receptor)